MIRHYILTIYRSFLRAKSYFFINVIGLSAGIACALLIFLWVRDEYKVNRFRVLDDRRYQVLEHQHYVDDIMTTTSTPGPLAETLAQEFPEVELGAATSWVDSYTLSVGDHNVKANGFHVGEAFFQIFPFHLIAGQPDQVMKDKSSMVISQDLALKLFGPDEDPLGKTVTLQRDKVYQVTGIFEGTPANSSLQFDFTISFEVFVDENPWVREWGNNGPPTYVMLRSGADGKAFSEKLGGYLKTKDSTSNVQLFATPYVDQYLYGNYEDGVQSGGRIEYVRLFTIIAVFIIVIACINFMNLATARASEKAREVGIRKSIGAQRRSLAAQYLIESLILSALSTLIAVVFVLLFLPTFNEITGKRIAFEFTDGNLMLMLSGLTLLTGLMAGSYPALYLSGFKPTAVLKGQIKGSVGELWARKGLVIFQFFLSVILIASVLVVYRQIDFIQSKNLGYNREHLIKFPIAGKVRSNLETFLNELRRLPGVVNASSAGHSFAGRNSSTTGVEWEGKNPDDRILFENVPVDYNLLETIGVELAAGRFFSRDFGTDTARVIFNESAIRAMNLQDPVGQRVKIWGQDREIIGVIRDFHFESLHDGVAPLYFRLAPESTWTVVARLEGGREKEALEKIESLYRSFNPGFIFEYRFQDQDYARQYEAEQRVAILSSWFAGIAILISCLGIFGLAAFTAERRRKEIGIRKSLGSTSGGIVMLLSADFTKMVIVAILLGIPVSYWLLDQWLQRFAFRITLEYWYFAATGGAALLIAWVTVATQAIRAARVNPVDCLRTE